ncbi:MAG: hypothetical protein KKG75_05320 [Nanoarchaeota archaeon]|nr:hypothetical protein [Nanoarchaeota archaeon]
MFNEVIKLFFEKKYLEWPEYVDRISKIENLIFMTRTSQQSINNYWRKRG